MSIMCCVYVPEGIVLAADSRLTRTKQTKPPVELPIKDSENKMVLLPETTYTLSDNAQKVILIKKVNVGVSFCGNALIDGVTVADYIRKFEIDKVKNDDTTEEVAEKLSAYYGGRGTHFFVCGYDNDAPYVYDVNAGSVRRSNVVLNRSDEKVAKDVASEGEDDSPEVGAPENLKDAALQNDIIDTEVEVIRYGATWAGQMTAITKIVNNPPCLNADWDTMPLKDAIDFAEFLIDTTIKYERFCDDIQTCGGYVDILVINKDGAFWKQHKIYNPI